jgi:hypothetical protein
MKKKKGVRSFKEIQKTLQQEVFKGENEIRNIRRFRFEVISDRYSDLKNYVKSFSYNSGEKLITLEVFNLYIVEKLMDTFPQEYILKINQDIPEILHFIVFDVDFKPIYRINFHEVRLKSRKASFDYSSSAISTETLELTYTHMVRENLRFSEESS